MTKHRTKEQVLKQILEYLAENGPINRNHVISACNASSPESRKILRHATRVGLIWTEIAPEESHIYFTDSITLEGRELLSDLRKEVSR